MMHSTQPSTDREIPVSSSARVAIVHPGRVPRSGLRVPLSVLLVPLYWSSFLPCPPFQQISEGLLDICSSSTATSFHQVSLKLSLHLLLDRDVEIFSKCPSSTNSQRRVRACSDAASRVLLLLVWSRWPLSVYYFITKRSGPPNGWHHSLSQANHVSPEHWPHLPPGCVGSRMCAFSNEGYFYGLTFCPW